MRINIFAENAGMRTFRDLLVWQKSMRLVTQIYSITQAFPQTELFGLTSQIRRSSISIPSNIAEGYGRRSDKEFSRYLRISMGSLFELQTQLEIAHDLKFISDEQFKIINESGREVERLLTSFSKTLQKSIVN